jgi:Uma2 family endonuclease
MLRIARAILGLIQAFMEKKMSTTTGIRVTPHEYLRLERLAETRSEYFEGEILPMPGVTREHNLINGNLVFELKSQLSGRPCEVYFCEMRVKVPATTSYAYPDVAALCGESIFEDATGDTLLNPQVLIEILSESTERHDRGLKLRHYRSIESLQEYVLVSQSECRVERYARQPAGEWTYSDITDPASDLDLSAIACRLSIARVYDRIFFQA